MGINAWFMKCPDCDSENGEEQIGTDLVGKQYVIVMVWVCRDCGVLTTMRTETRIGSEKYG